MNARHLCLLAALQAATLPASAAEWAVDPARSAIRFSGVQVGVPFTGRFERFKADIDFDPAKPEAGHALVRVDLASARTGDVQRDEALPQKDWFDVRTAREARFAATGFVDKGQGDYVATGTLTIRGMSQPVTLPFHFAVEGGTAHATGRVGLVRTAFGVGQGAWASGQWVALDVGVEVDIVATAQPASGR
jgi:polyisoprenoid-binding protein YceI